MNHHTLIVSWGLCMFLTVVLAITKGRSMFWALVWSFFLGGIAFLVYIFLPSKN